MLYLRASSWMTWTIVGLSGETRTYTKVRPLPHMKCAPDTCYAAQGSTGTDVSIVVEFDKGNSELYCVVYTRSGRRSFSGFLAREQLEQ